MLTIDVWLLTTFLLVALVLEIIIGGLLLRPRGLLD